jgi:hypothetical protein
MDSNPRSCQIIVTADGNAAAFSAVFQLAEVAPQIPGCAFLFLVPPMAKMYAVDVDDATRVTVDDVQFRYTRRGNRFDLDLFVRGLSESNRRYVESGARDLVLAIVGEYFFGTRIGVIRYHAFPESERQENLDPLPDMLSVLNSDLADDR